MEPDLSLVDPLIELAEYLEQRDYTDDDEDSDKNQICSHTAILLRRLASVSAAILVADTKGYENRWPAIRDSLLEIKDIDI